MYRVELRQESRTFQPDIDLTTPATVHTAGTGLALSPPARELPLRPHQDEAGPPGKLEFGDVIGQGVTGDPFRPVRSQLDWPPGQALRRA
jgi:hypothetical protein